MKFLALLAVVGIVNSIDVPIFPNKYEAKFHEKSSLGIVSGETNGQIYIDADNNQQLITREDGRADRYCGTVFKLQHTRCNHYVVNNKRYLDFPDKKYCCFCCDSDHGCGIVKPDWLAKAGATYNGSETLPGDSQPSQKWYIKGIFLKNVGGQDNYYYHKDDSLKTPRRLYQVPEDTIDYTSYYVGIQNPHVFDLPSYCTDKCGATTICAALRGDESQLTSENDEEVVELE